MATNFEFYNGEIMEIVEQKKGIAVVNNRPIICDNTLCNICELKCDFCEWRFIQWLLKDHIELPKLTKRERAFCEAVQAGWITRDKNGRIHWRDNEPEKTEGCWYGKTIAIPLNVLIRDCFSFVKWEDEKPWSVEDLLKLEVIEEVQK